MTPRHSQHLSLSFYLLTSHGTKYKYIVRNNKQINQRLKPCTKLKITQHLLRSLAISHYTTPTVTIFIIFKKQSRHRWENAIFSLATCTLHMLTVLEYAAPVWHHSLNKSQKNQIEAIQKTAIRIIYSCACDMPYTSGLHLAGVEDRDKRRGLLSHKFFISILQPTSCSHNLLPPPRDPELLSRLRAPSKYPRIANRTKKYQSFISYALAHYQ